MKKKIFLAVFISVISTTLHATEYPLTIDNCGVKETFEAAPKSIVSVGQAATEILYALDQADKVKGTSVWFSDVNKKYKDIDSNVERITDNDPSFEAVLEKHPDFVIAQYEYHISDKGVVGTRDQFKEAGVKTYILPTDCVGKNNMESVDGSREKMFSPELLYQSIKDISTILDAEEAGQNLIAELKEREKTAGAKAEDYKKQDMSVVFWYSSPTDKSDAWVAGKYGVPGYMSSVTGLRNIVQSEEEWPAVSWETIADENPTYIVVARMDRRRHAMDDYEKKINFLKNDPLTSKMDAVKNDRIIVMDSLAMDPTLNIFDGLDTLTKALEQHGK